MESVEAPVAGTERRRSRPSVIWLVPCFAALLGILVAVQSASQRGPLIEIHFATAGGVEAGETHIRYKELVVGEVERVDLSEDLLGVVVYARLEKEMAEYIGDTTEFWIVSAQISGTQIRGLNTLLSGSYIEMDFSGEPEVKKRVFQGLEDPPLTDPGTPGRRIKLVSKRGAGMAVGTTINYRQIPVGKVESRELSLDGMTVQSTAFISAPYDAFITTESRFWNVSGFRVGTTSEGLSVHVDSLSSLISGGIAFAAITNKAGAAINEDGHQFFVYANESEALESQFALDDQEGFRFITRFSEPAGGLKAGAPVSFAGITVGRVVDTVADIDRSVVGPPEIYSIIQLQPSRLTQEEVSEEEFRTVLAELVQRGLRAQLSMTNPLTGALSVRLALLPDQDEATLYQGESLYPEIPTAPSGVAALTRNFEELMASLASLPLEDLIVAATELLNTGSEVLSDPELRALPGEIRTLARGLSAFAVRAELALEGLSPDSELYVELSTTIAELEASARAVGRLADRLEEQPNSLLVGRN